MSTSFVHLHNHSEFSLLDGLSKIPEMVARVKKLKQPALALTDHGVMYGTVKFYLECKEQGIKPIIGCEVYIAQRSHFDKEAGIDKDQNHLILLAKNEKGYKNLMKLVTKAYLEGFYYKPRIDFELLNEYREGLIASSACIEGVVAALYRQNRDKEAEKKARELVDIFGKDFYLEIMDHPKISDQDMVNQKLIELSRKLGTPLIATNDNHYVEPDDAEAQDALLAIQTKKTVSDKNRLSMLDSPDFYIKSTAEMQAAFAQYPDALKNTLKIADECNLEIPMNQLIYPEFPLPKNETPESFLKKLTEKRMKLRFPEPDKEILDRVKYELDVITQKGYSAYFLIVQDFVNWAKKQGIRVGPGRGSAAGSLVSYILRITSINPIRHNIPFERFLNPQRPSPPDIDLDFADERRDEVIAYVTKKYGVEKVAQIITFGTMEARGSIRDIGRALGFPYSDPDKIAKSIPIGESIKTALVKSKEFKAYYADERFKKLINLAMKVEGCARHASTHAAGVIIADKDLTDYTPLQRESKGDRIVTQYDMYSLDLNVSDNAIGLMKMDFLGLRNLTILQKTIDLVQEEKGVKVDISEVSLEEPEPFDLIKKGSTIGVFQLESGGMRRLAKNLQPTKFSDITAMVALYRPGPMDLIPDFINNKNHPESIKYPHKDLKPILEESYGILLYQDQVLQIANLMAGYSMAEADMLRRAMGKKKAYIMVKEKKKFIQGAEKRGYTQRVADKVWNYVEKFAGYGFNKAHSVSYASIAYQTAYMKGKYPVEFMTALLTADSGASSGPTKDEKISRAVAECRRMGINILPPDINKSQTWFNIEKDPLSLEGLAIRFGLAAIKNVGEAAISEILKARKLKKEFKSLSDFCFAVDNQKVNKKVLESLIQVGAMDMFGTRAAQMTALEKIRERSMRRQEQKKSGQSSLFEVIPIGSSLPGDIEEADNLPDMEEFSKSDLLSLEKNLLGLYLTEHPMARALERLAELIKFKLEELNKFEHDNHRITVGGIINSVRKIVTKKGNKEMAFASLNDGTGSIDLVIFPKTYEQIQGMVCKDKVIVVKGRVDYGDTKLALLVEEAREFNEDSKSLFEADEEEATVEIKIPKNTSKARLQALNELLRSSQGERPVVILLPNGSDTPKRIRLNYGISYSADMRSKIAGILGLDS